VDSFAFPGLDGYQLLDSGHAEKLERFGPYVLRRPDPQALWRPRLAESEWGNADFIFVREDDRGGKWRKKRSNQPIEWQMEVGDASFRIHPTPFKHVGLFPEQASNWAWVEERRQELAPQLAGERPKLLNLFGYTGAASILAAKAGWFVTHLDASKASLDWANVNAQASGTPSDGIRWLLEDALKFTEREVRRGNRYHGILVDPPHYGRGPKGEKWQFQDGIARLLEACHRLLEDYSGSFLVLSTYAIGFSPMAFENMLNEFEGGEVQSGELWLPEGDGARRLPCGFCSRWKRVGSDEV
jgi:23S rRNA (cytosine1962-C5)-methyltransferase